MNSDKTRFMRFKQSYVISLNGRCLKLADQFTYLGSSILFTKNDINICIGKAWTAIDRLMSTWKSDLSNQREKRNSSKILLKLLYSCTTWTLMKCLEKRCCILFWTNPGSSIPQNNSCTVTYLPNHSSKANKHISVDLTAKICIHQLCADTGCSLEDLPRVMTARDGWQERVKRNCAIITI